MARNPPRSSRSHQTSIDATVPPPAPADARAVSTELIRWEGYCPHMFVDGAGQVTTGVGHRLPNAAAAVALPWRHRATEMPATPDEIRSAFAYVRAQGPGHRSLTYRLASDLVLAPGVAGGLAIARVERELLPGLRRLLLNFDGYPLSAQRALVDIAYTVGLEELTSFRNLLAACERRDFATAAEHCHRRATREIRNAATRDLFRQAAEASSKAAFAGKNARLDGG